MNPNLCRVALRPRGPLEVFDLGVRVVAARPGTFLRLLGLVVLPLWVPLGVGVALFPDAGWWVVAAVLPLAVLVQLPFTVLGGKLLFQDRVTAREVLGDLARLAAPALQAAAVHALVCFVGLAACGVGWIVFAVPTLFVPETALLERVDFARQLRRASRLASAHPFSVIVGAGGWLALTAWSAVVTEAAGSALLGTVLQLGSPFGTLYGGVATPWVVLGVLLAQPVFAIYRILLYVDVRTRVEGWDLQVRLRAAGIG